MAKKIVDAAAKRRKVGDLRQQLGALNDKRSEQLEAATTAETAVCEAQGKLATAADADKPAIEKTIVDETAKAKAAYLEAAKLSSQITAQQNGIAKEEEELRQIDEANSAVEAGERTQGAKIGGDGEQLGGPRIEAQPLTTEQRQHDLTILIRCVALAPRMHMQPMDIAKQHFKNDRLYSAMAASVFAAGGAFVPENYVPDIIEYLRPFSVVRRMGPRLAPLNNGNMTIPKITSGTTASYIGENQNIPNTAITGGQIKLTAKKLAALVPISNDLIAFSNPSADRLVRDDLVQAVGTAEDIAFIRGLGVGNAPKGLRYWALSTNVNAINGTINLANVDADLASKGYLPLANANVRMSNCGWIMAPRTFSYLSTLRDGNGNKAFPEISQNPPMLKGYPVAVTTNIPINLGGGTNESEIYFVDFDQIIIADDPRFRLEASTEAAYWDGSAIQAAFSLDQTVIRIIVEHDMAPRHAGAISVLTGVTWGA